MREAHVLPSKYTRSPSANGSAASFASHSPRLVRSLAAHTSGHESRITRQTNSSAAGVLMEEKKRLRKSGASVRPQARHGQHTQGYNSFLSVARGCAVGRGPQKEGSVQKMSMRPTF